MTAEGPGAGGAGGDREGLVRQRPWPNAATGLVVLLGWPVEHSLSPVMHNAAFSELGINLVYLALPTPEDDLAVVVEALGAAGAIGANVTVPHKQAVVDSCDVLTEEAELIGAVNTLAWTAQGLLGDNTDAAGLQESLEEDVALAADAPAVVLGTGGAARAAMVALGRRGAPTTVVGRRPEAAERLAGLATRAGSPQARGVDLADPEEVGEAVAGAGLVVNATPLGMDGEVLPEPFQQLGAEQVAYDLVYNATTSGDAPGGTPFLRAARERGAETHHGLGMLVAQAGVAFERWTGRPPPLTTMSAVATAAVAGSARRTDREHP